MERNFLRARICNKFLFKMVLIQALQEVNAKRGVIFIAVENLVLEEDIKNFYSEYVKYISAHGNSLLAGINPEEAAGRNIAYTLQDYPKDIMRYWARAIPELEPISKELNPAPQGRLYLAKKLLPEQIYRLLRNII
ncbi:hypothetical protein HYX04_05010 [Candidatus Woesearchaeota archaeon]|nr:hypothetical protein [Candidatus Woesearchaeota archaeon]